MQSPEAQQGKSNLPDRRIGQSAGTRDLVQGTHAVEQQRHARLRWLGQHLPDHIGRGARGVESEQILARSDVSRDLLDGVAPRQPLTNQSRRMAQKARPFRSGCHARLDLPTPSAPAEQREDDALVVAAHGRQQLISAQEAQIDQHPAHLPARGIDHLLHLLALRR